jgi:hypothetical protein
LWWWGFLGIEGNKAHAEIQRSKIKNKEYPTKPLRHEEK